MKKLSIILILLLFSCSSTNVSKKVKSVSIKAYQTPFRVNEGKTVIIDNFHFTKGYKLLLERNSKLIVNGVVTGEPNIVLLKSSNKNDRATFEVKDCLQYAPKEFDRIVVKYDAICNNFALEMTKQDWSEVIKGFYEHEKGNWITVSKNGKFKFKAVLDWQVIKRLEGRGYVNITTKKGNYLIKF